MDRYFFRSGAPHGNEADTEALVQVHLFFSFAYPLLSDLSLVEK